MFATKSKNLTLTLIVSLVLILSLFPVSEANDFQAVNRRTHNRLIKKRSPQGGILGPLVGAAPDPKANDSASSSLASTGGSTQISSSSSSPSTSASSTSSTSASSSRSSAISSSSSSSSTSSSTSSSSSSSSSTSSSPTTHSSSSSSVPSNTHTSDPSQATQTSSDDVQVVVQTNSAGMKVTVTQTTTNPTQTSPVNSQSGATSTSKAKSTALTVLIVIAASVGAVILFWTIFRKWKLARSSKFDQRLQPIDWQPTSNDEGIIPANRRRHSGASSFRSGYGGTSESHFGSDHGHRGGLPEHDFTAGPSHLTPVGGYADLARGPSPQPMQQLGRGPSLSRPNYDVGVPLHHQAPYGGRY